MKWGAGSWQMRHLLESCGGAVPCCKASEILAARSSRVCTAPVNRRPDTPAPTAMKWPSGDLRTSRE